MASSATAFSDPVQLFHLLETADVEVDEIKALIHEHLNQTKEPSYLNSLIDFCLMAGYPRCMDLLAGVREPHDKHLFDKLNDALKGNSRQQALTLLSHVVYKYPSWLYKISQHSLLPALLKLMKTSSDILHLVGAVLIVVTLLPVIPSSVGPFLNDIFNTFTRLSAMHSKKTASIPEVYLMHLHVAIYALFHRLYSMYPWHFIGYMRAYCSENPRENLSIFDDTIKPMLDYVRLHPLLITASKEIEISKTRWKRMETHDIVVECAKLSLDVVEGTREDCPGPWLSYSCFRPIQEVCELLYPSVGFICPTSKVPAEANDDSIVGASSRVDPLAVNWSPSITCGLSTPPRSHQMSPGASYAEVCVRRMESSGAGTPTAQQSVPPSPLRIESSSPFKFPPICEHPSSHSSSVMYDSCTEALVSSRSETTTGAPMMTTLKQVVKKLEAQKSTEREELADTEVASIIGQGPSGRSSTTAAAAAAQQLPRVVRVPSQWASVSPYLKSLQSTQRSRSFSQGKKGPRRSTVEVADRRVPTITKSRSLPELRALATSAHESSLDSEADGQSSASRVPCSGRSAFTECGVESSASNVQTTSTSGQLCSNYAHLLPSAFPRLPAAASSGGGSGRMSKACYASPDQPPLFAQLSPSEILDRYIEGCRDVYSKKTSIGAASGFKDQTSTQKDKAQVEEIDVLRRQVQLLHVQLMYERQKREIHAERNRRLLGKVKRAKALEEENMAMKDQMQLQEKEIAQLSWTAIKHRNERFSTGEKKDSELEAVRTELNTVLSEKKALTEICNDLEAQFADTKLKVTELEKEIGKLASELFNTHHDLEAIKSHVALNETLKREVGRLNKELLLSIEMNQKCHEKIVALQSGALFEVKLSSLREAYATEMRGLKSVLESKEVIADGAKARVAELEGLLAKKDKIIVEQKRLFKVVKQQCDEQVASVEEKYASRKSICQHLESEVLKLHHKLGTIAADRTRRLWTPSKQPSVSQLPLMPESVVRQKIAEVTAMSPIPDTPIRSAAADMLISSSVASSSMISTAVASTSIRSTSSTEFGGTRRKTSEPINIDRPQASSSSSAIKSHRPVPIRKADVGEIIRERLSMHDDDQEKAIFRDSDERPDEFHEEERLSGALELIASRSLVSIVDFGESALELEASCGHGAGDS